MKITYIHKKVIHKRAKQESIQKLTDQFTLSFRHSRLNFLKMIKCRKNGIYTTILC